MTNKDILEGLNIIDTNLAEAKKYFNKNWWNIAHCHLAKAKDITELLLKGDYPKGKITP